MDKQLWAGGGAAAPAAGGAPAADKLGASQPVPGTPVSIRVPTAFTSPPMADGAGDARRAKPGIVTIPGLKQTYEGFVEDQVHGQWAYYCYVGVTGGPVQNVATQLRDELAKKYPAGLSDWKDVSCNSPDGQALKWRQLRLVGKQDLYYKNKDGKEQSPIPNVDGVLEIYLYEKGPQVVIVAWRMPASIEPNVGLAELAPLVAGSVNVK